MVQHYKTPVRSTGTLDYQCGLFDLSFLKSSLRKVIMVPERVKIVYRSVLFQIVIVGLVAFCEPGIWTALNNLGAGGNASVGTIKQKLVAVAHIEIAIPQQCCKCAHLRAHVCRLLHRRRHLQQDHSEVDAGHRRRFLHALCCRLVLQQQIRQ